MAGWWCIGAGLLWWFLGVEGQRTKLGYFTTDAGVHSVTTRQAKAISAEIDDLSK